MASCTRDAWIFSYSKALCCGHGSAVNPLHCGTQVRTGVNTFSHVWKCLETKLTHLLRHGASKTAQHLVQHKLLGCSLFLFVLRKSERDSDVSHGLGRGCLQMDSCECPDLPSFENTSLGPRTCSTHWQVSLGSRCVYACVCRHTSLSPAPR